MEFVNKLSLISLFFLMFPFMSIAHAADKLVTDNVSDGPHISRC